LWVFLCACVCLQAIAIAGVEIDSSACAYVACVHPVRTGFAKCKSTLSLLCWSSSTESSSFGDGIFLLHNWWIDWRRPHLSEGDGNCFSFQQSMRRLAMSCLISFADGDFLLLHNRWGEILETRGMLNSTKCFLLTWTNHNHGRLQRKCRPRAEIQPIRHAVGSFKWLYKG